MNKGIVVRAAGGIFLVDDGAQLWSCTGKGAIRHKDQGVLLSAGDRVQFEPQGELKGSIVSIDKRTNYFFRPKIANLDHVVVVQELTNAPWFTLLLDRYLAFFESRTVKDLLIVFTKRSNLEEQTKSAADLVIAGYKRDGYAVFDAESELEGIRSFLTSGITMFVGQTGAGKSTLANKIEPSFGRFSQEVSAGHGRGKHTTTEVRLLRHEKGYIADTPGFSTLHMDLTERELARSFHDFAVLANACKFTDCRHLVEKGCAVIEAVRQGRISEWRWKNYASMVKEMREKN